MPRASHVAVVIAAFAAVAVATTLGCSNPSAASMAAGLVDAGADASVAHVVAATDAGAASQRARLYDEPSLFTRKRRAKSGEWLDRFPESGQTFGVYEQSSPVHPTPTRGKLVLQPLGTFAPADTALLAKLQEHMSIFFALPVESRSPIALPKRGTRTKRSGGRSWVQHLTGAIMDDVLVPRLPDDAVVYLGITNVDLYPGDEWNYVFGQARLESRVGVYSVARLFASFDGLKDDEASQRRGLARSTAILTHETGHAFGIKHCTAFECVMNGTNSLEELDSQFAEPCPVCLRKLTWNIGLDPIARYEKLREFYRREQIDELATWLDRRLAQVSPR